MIGEIFILIIFVAFPVIGIVILSVLLFGSRVDRINTQVISMIKQTCPPDEVLAYLNTEGYSQKKAHRFLNNVTFGSRGSELKETALDELSSQNWFLAYKMQYFPPDETPADCLITPVKENFMFHKGSHMVPAFISAVLLLMAIGGWPYGFYVFVRIVVFASAIYLTFASERYKKTILAWIIIIVGVLFNPILPFEFSRETWQILDVVGAIAFFVSIPILSLSDFKVLADSVSRDIEAKHREKECVSQQNQYIDAEAFQSALNETLEGMGVKTESNLTPTPIQYTLEGKTLPEIEHLLDSHDLKLNPKALTSDGKLTPAGEKRVRKWLKEHYYT